MPSILVNGKINRDGARANKSGLMVAYTRVTGKMTKHVARVS